MDDLRVTPLGFFDSHPGQTKDRSKRRSGQDCAEPQEQEDVADQVILSSATEYEEQPPCYSPASVRRKTD
jgi:hypothetical protein